MVHRTPCTAPLTASPALLRLSRQAAIAEYELAGVQDVNPGYSRCLRNIGLVCTDRDQQGVAVLWQKRALLAEEKINGLQVREHGGG